MSDEWMGLTPKCDAALARLAAEKESLSPTLAGAAPRDAALCETIAANLFAENQRGRGPMDGWSNLPNNLRQFWYHRADEVLASAPRVREGSKKPQTIDLMKALIASLKGEDPVAAAVSGSPPAGGVSENRARLIETAARACEAWIIDPDDPLATDAVKRCPAIVDAVLAALAGLHFLGSKEVSEDLVGGEGPAIPRSQYEAALKGSGCIEIYDPAIDDFRLYDVTTAEGIGAVVAELTGRMFRAAVAANFHAVRATPGTGEAT